MSVCVFVIYICVVYTCSALFVRCRKSKRLGRLFCFVFSYYFFFVRLQFLDEPLQLRDDLISLIGREPQRVQQVFASLDSEQTGTTPPLLLA